MYTHVIKARYLDERRRLINKKLKALDGVDATIASLEAEKRRIVMDINDLIRGARIGAHHRIDWR